MGVQNDRSERVADLTIVGSRVVFQGPTWCMTLGRSNLRERRCKDERDAYWPFKSQRHGEFSGLPYRKPTVSSSPCDMGKLSMCAAVRARATWASERVCRVMAQ